MVELCWLCARLKYFVEAWRNYEALIRHQALGIILLRHGLIILLRHGLTVFVNARVSYPCGLLYLFNSCTPSVV